MSSTSSGELALGTLAVMVIAAVFGVMGTFMAPSVAQFLWLLVGLVEGIGLALLGAAGVLAVKEHL